MTTIELLERELHLKQLLINRLLEITQAINNNMTSSSLYRFYENILTWEVGVKGLLLFMAEVEVKNGEEYKKWIPVVVHGIEPALVEAHNIDEYLSTFKKTSNVIHKEHPLLSHCKIVIPVHHKKNPIAYAFIGDIETQNNEYEVVQFVTTITNIVAVAIENKRLFKQQIQQERFKHEMKLAERIQGSLIPKILPQNAHYSLSGIYIPHGEVGGDYYDCINLKNGEIIFCIADVSGKGISGAILMSNFQANLHALIHKRTSPENFIDLLNQAVMRITKGDDRFITLFVAKYNATTRKLIYINAGHNPPLLLQGKEITLLDKGCSVLGVFKKFKRIEVGEIILEQEALVVTYTDGLTDLFNAEGEYFGQKAFEQFVRENSHLDVKEFNEKLLATIDSYKGSENPPDDISVLICKIPAPLGTTI